MLIQEQILLNSPLSLCLMTALSASAQEEGPCPNGRLGSPRPYSLRTDLCCMPEGLSLAYFLFL